MFSGAELWFNPPVFFGGVGGVTGLPRSFVLQNQAEAAVAAMEVKQSMLQGYSIRPPPGRNLLFYLHSGIFCFS
ncbi:hypothetical protein Tfer_2339 [Thermincola ferriacetica]|uniref:Uncharacterized protein n=1 Tax=Thermincola ferriacetica TaxID=281456 RepID=A0A0L6W1N0_9FIRM|nr:hypothetical protein Tfer_2339 [Thermincola ferriacetica]